MSKKTTTIQTGHDYGRAMLDNSTFDKEARTIEVVFATETPVKRYSWSIDGVFNEILDISKAAMNSERLDTGGAPVLNSHSRWDLSSQIGVIERAWIDDGKKEARALLRLSGREDIQGIIKDIEDGIIRNISVGYSVQEYRVDKDKTPHEYRATKWTPSEISFVPVPADHNSGTRSKENSNITTTIISNSNNNMDEQNQEQERAPETKPAAQNPAPATTAVVDEAAIRKQAVDAERKRVADINALCDNIKLPNDAEFRSQLITDGISIDTARERAIDEVAKNANKPPVTVSVGEEKQSQRKAIELGLAYRANPDNVDIKGNEAAQKYANMRLLDVAKDQLAQNNERFDLLSEMDIVKRAIATTDYPNILTNTFRYNFLGFYNGVVQEWKKFASRKTATDFRRKDNLALDGNIAFEEIPEGGEVKEGVFLYEENHSIQLKSFGKSYSITRQAIINDEIGLFESFPRLLALGSQQFQSKKIWDLIVNNAKTSDGKALFHADHKNLITPGTALSIESLGIARAKMARQRTPASDLDLQLVPGVLVVPPELQTKAEQITSSIMATENGNVNPFAGKIQVVTSTALTSPTEWYLFADTSFAALDGIVYAYLNGNEGVSIESMVDFNTGNMKVKGLLDFDARVWNYQTMLKNAGA